jgi:hypothetical protein
MAVYQNAHSKQGDEHSYQAMLHERAAAGKKFGSY